MMLSANGLNVEILKLSLFDMGLSDTEIEPALAEFMTSGETSGLNSRELRSYFENYVSGLISQKETN